MKKHPRFSWSTLAASIALHLALLWPLPRTVILPPAPPAVQPPRQELSVTLLHAEGGRTGTSPIDQYGAPCGDKESYVGIGVIGIYVSTNFERQLVKEAPPALPAYQAGVRVGDLYVNAGGEPDAEGFLIVEVLRDNKPLTFKVKTRKICYAEK